MSGETDDSQQRVTYSVKELLGRIDNKLDTMALAIAAKAEQAHLDKVEGRVEVLEAESKSAKALNDVYLAQWNTALNDIQRLKTTPVVTDAFAIEHKQLLADVETLKSNSTGTQAVATYKRWLIATGIALVASVATLAAIIVKFIH